MFSPNGHVSEEVEQRLQWEILETKKKKGSKHEYCTAE